MDKESISKMAAALQQVAENKKTEFQFEIPETIQAAERTAFHGAAAAAHKSGKSHFDFQGKKYPVTMSKDAAKAISDDVKENKNAALAKKLAKASASSDKGKAAVTLPKAPFEIPKKTKNEEGEVIMNPKKENKKDKSSTEVSAVEDTAWPVYKRIMEKRGEHYKSATPVQEPNDASKSSKGAQDMLNTPKEVKDNPEASGDDVKKASTAGPSMKARPNDGKVGDKKIIPSATKA